MVPSEVKGWLLKNDYGEITRIRSVGGGCISHGAHIETSSNKKFFLKTNSAAPIDLFAREADGLMALKLPHGPRIPEVCLFGVDFLLLEDLSPATPRNDYWQLFGLQLATLHGHTSPRFGFNHDNYIGSTPQSNPWEFDGYLFFGQQRLLFQAQLAYDRGLLATSERHQVERLVSRLPDLIPKQPASLLHGDLWSGNIISDEKGYPALIDPAVYYGWAEAELAMTDLFGSLPEVFYQAYQSVRRLEDNFRERYPLYNLYHLLNHLNLFGGGYLSQVKAILRRFG
ncbi:MAG TPA: fructosamine kinase family protein [Anaerolineales bacterium]|nr:fructosamine kinase family protein [Anaerolineales bacterium]